MRFIKQEEVRFRHVDFAGIVFYPRFLEMLNDLVEDWFSEALLNPFGKMHKDSGIPTVNLQVNFKKPARIGDLLSKQLWVVSLGDASVRCGFEFTDAHHSVVLSGEVTLVNVGLDKEQNKIKAVPFSDPIKRRIKPFTITSDGI